MVNISLSRPTFERVEHEVFGTERWRWKVRLPLGLAARWHTTAEYAQALRCAEAGIQKAPRTSSQKYIALGLALHGKIIANLGDTWHESTGQERAAATLYGKSKATIDFAVESSWHEESPFSCDLDSLSCQSDAFF